MKTPTNTITLFTEVGKIIKDRMRAGLPLSYAQCETIRLLDEVENPMMRTIVEHFKITAPSATSIVNDLVKKGLVARAGNANDRREVLLRLTPVGKKMLRTVMKKRTEIITELLSTIGEKDRRELDTILAKIITGSALTK